MQNPKLLIIRPDVIGDCLLITPAIDLLRKKYPNAHIAVLSNSYTEPIFLNNPDVNEVIIDPFFKKKRTSISEFFKFVKEIKQKNFEASIHFYNELPYALLARFAGIKNRIGDTSKPLLTWLYTKKVKQNWNDLTIHEVENNIRLLKPFGIENQSPPPLKITVPRAGIDFCNTFKNQFGIAPTDLLIGIHLGTGRGNKPYLPDRYAKIVKILISDFKAKVVLLGSNKELDAAEEIMISNNREPIDLVGKTTLEQLIGIISILTIYVGVDTGPLHIASALKKRIAAIFGTKFVKPSRWGPWQTPHQIVRRPLSCTKRCLPSACRFDDCLREIPINDVIEAIIKLTEYKSSNKEEWFRLSANILTNDENIYTELKFNGYNAIKQEGFSFIELIDGIITRDTNIIHWAGRAGQFKAILARLMAIPFLPIPPLLITDNERGFRNHRNLIKTYEQGFQARNYL